MLRSRISQLFGLKEILPAMTDSQNVDHIPSDFEQVAVCVAALAVMELAQARAVLLCL